MGVAGYAMALPHLHLMLKIVNGGWGRREGVGGLGGGLVGLRGGWWV